MLNKKISKLKLFLIIFLIGNISFYFNERSKWIYVEQPYPEAKEWLIPANMMLVYGTWLTKLPFVDERSIIMKPVIGLQDFFVSKWQENLPEDDAEKYLAWYIFKFMTYIKPNSGGVVLYGKKEYSFDEVIYFNNKTYETLKNLVKYKAKDTEFNEIRYAAFNNLSALFVANFTTYWSHNPINSSTGDELRYLTNKSYLDTKTMLKDKNRYQMLFQVHNWIYQMNNEYKKYYQDIFNKAKEVDSSIFWENHRLHNITRYILFYLIETKQYKTIEGFCEKNKNIYLDDYIRSRSWLIKNEESLKTKKISLKKTLSRLNDNLIIKTCSNIKLTKEK